MGTKKNISILSQEEVLSILIVDDKTPVKKEKLRYYFVVIFNAIAILETECSFYTSVKETVHKILNVYQNELITKEDLVNAAILQFDLCYNAAKHIIEGFSSQDNHKALLLRTLNGLNISKNKSVGFLHDNKVYIMQVTN